MLLTRTALADILETLKKGDKQVPIEVIRRTKDVEENVNLYKPIIDELDGVSVMQKNIYTVLLKVFMWSFIIETRGYCW